ncbi:hypothetical protein [Streptomyces gilvus]|uniref:hypothetical protein n=1 Tax=Streptomyces gilvus TaxID=2920937 RepID=UPI001F10D3F8|nr:hypothetical protein [Streptomyces sp. CME 23]MCH5676339.1 hypothetical protein [Streptomyces sp. CME 23]
MPGPVHGHPGQPLAPGATAAVPSAPYRTAWGHHRGRHVPGPPRTAHRAAGLADVGNLHIAPAAGGTALEHHLLAQAAAWLRLSNIDRLLAYEPSDDEAAITVLLDAGFRELTRTDRHWAHRPGSRGPDAVQIPGR